MVTSLAFIQCKERENSLMPGVPVSCDFAKTLKSSVETESALIGQWHPKRPKVRGAEISSTSRSPKPYSCALPLSPHF